MMVSGGHSGIVLLSNSTCVFFKEIIIIIFLYIVRVLPASPTASHALVCILIEARQGQGSILLPLLQMGKTEATCCLWPSSEFMAEAKLKLRTSFILLPSLSLWTTAQCCQMGWPLIWVQEGQRMLHPCVLRPAPCVMCAKSAECHPRQPVSPLAFPGVGGGGGGAGTWLQRVDFFCSRGCPPCWETKFQNWPLHPWQDACSRLGNASPPPPNPSRHFGPRKTHVPSLPPSLASSLR